MLGCTGSKVGSTCDRTYHATGTGWDSPLGPRVRREGHKGFSSLYLRTRRAGGLGNASVLLGLASSDAALAAARFIGWAYGRVWSLSAFLLWSSPATRSNGLASDELPPAFHQPASPLEQVASLVGPLRCRSNLMTERCFCECPILALIGAPTPETRSESMRTT